MKIVICRIGKGKCSWADQAVQEWSKRIRQPLVLEEVRYKPAPEQSGKRFDKAIEERRLKESTQIQSYIRDNDILVVLDERGAQPTTEEFTDWIQGYLHRGVSRVVFAIGGPFGHHSSLRKRADKVLSLSSMVVNHELARVILYEQIYRSYSLMTGGKYHH
jgi:23S rRNA (pseudouridine1915-N3)-methyltransferase